MSEQRNNGGPPEGSRVATKEELERVTTTWLACHRASARLGAAISVRVRAIDESELWLASPDLPDEAADVPGPERAAWIGAWERSLSPEQRRERRRAQFGVNYEIISAALLEPRLTPDQVRQQFAGDIVPLANAVLRFSGLLQDEAPEPAQEAEEAARALPPAPVAVE